MEMRDERFEESLVAKRAGVRRDLVFTRQVLRGRACYVVHDPVTFKNHVFDLLEYRIITGIRHTVTLAEVFDEMVANGELDEGERDDFFRFVLSLYRWGLLQLPAEDAAALYGRHALKTASRRRGILRWFVYHKIPLLDPDRFLDRTVGIFGKAFSSLGFVLWCGLLIFALWMCSGRFGAMFGETSNLLTLANVPVLYLAMVVLKVVHEFGHAYACKRFGCEVPEMGMILIFATPCAYVDASASWKLTSRWRRVAIGLAGMYIELAVAAVFALIWAGTQPGFLHDVAVNVIVLASLVTLLFNVNPLMRFDGYYVLTDLLGRPNLWERSKRYIQCRAKRLFLGLRPHEEPDSPAARRLYATYGLAALVYKAFLAVAIVAMVITNWPLAGTLLGIAFCYTFLIAPVIRLVRYLLVHPETTPVRWRARCLALTGALAIPGILCFAPMSREIVAPGVLEPERRVVMRAPGDGFVTDIGVVEGDPLRVGQPVVRLENPKLALQLTRSERELHAAEVRLSGAELVDPTTGVIQRSRVALLASRCDRLQKEVQSLRMSAAAPGVVAARWVDPGSFVGVGEPIVEIHSGRPSVRIVLTDHDVQRTRLSRGDVVELRFCADPGRTVRAAVHQVLPTASRDSVPSALTILGGGEIYGSENGTTGAAALRAERPYSQVVLHPEWVPRGRTAGFTARVRLAAETETVGGWLIRHLAGFYHSWRMG